MTTSKEKTAYEKAVEEIRNGAFSVLSDKAQNRLIDLLLWVSQDSYENGCNYGKRLAAVQKMRAKKK